MLRALPSWILAIIAMATALVTASAQGRPSIALVIGNDKYGTPALDLKFPAASAIAFADELTRLGFDVSLLTNTNSHDMGQALAAFYDHLESGQLALFFFSGHVVQIEKQQLSALCRRKRSWT
jgi:uncharacterized caspase-like protein